MRVSRPPPACPDWSANLDAQVVQAFRAFDKNNSGQLEFQELKLALQQLGLETTSHVARAILKSYDADSNQRISLSEFRQLIADLRAYYERVNALEQAVSFPQSPLSALLSAAPACFRLTLSS